MRIAIGVIASALMFCSTITFPQQGLLGTYIAYYEEQYDGSSHPGQVATLEIGSVQDGKMNGILSLGHRDCRGKYDIQGTYKDNKLDLRVGEGALKGCGGQQLVLEMQGGKLAGTLGQIGVEFSRK